MLLKAFSNMDATSSVVFARDASLRRMVSTAGECAGAAAQMRGRSIRFRSRLMAKPIFVSSSIVTGGQAGCGVARLAVAVRI